MKIKSVLCFCFMLLARSVWADGSEFGEFKKITNEDFRSRFFVKAELIVVSADGKSLLAPTTEIRIWKPGRKTKTIDVKWHTKSKAYRDMALHVLVELTDQNNVSATIQQFDKVSGHLDEPKFEKLIKEQKFEIQNFEPITYVVEQTNDHRMIARMTPLLDSFREGMSLEKLSIGGDRNSFIISDNQGFLWGDNIRFGGTISGMHCHRGAFVMSYYPFKGATVMGSAEGKTIELHFTDTLSIKIQNETELLPEDMRAKVYARYFPKLKSDSVQKHVSFGYESYENLAPEYK